MMRLKYTITDTKSNLIKGIDYNKDILTIDLGRSMYSYYKVPAEVALELITADSIGRYFNEYIKDEYNYRELQGVTDSLKVVA